jgi:hypothetical protein
LRNKPKFSKVLIKAFGWYGDKKIKKKVFSIVLVALETYRQHGPS